MPLGTWGYGTGATGAGTAYPFAIRIQGVDYIGSVPIESIAVNASVSSNATLTFTVIDPDAALPIPPAWADVEFVEYGAIAASVGAFDDDAFDPASFDVVVPASATTEAEWIFGGVVMGVELSYFGPLGVRMDIRCVDYGILLDVAPVLEPVNPSSVYVSSWVLAGAGATPLGGLTAREYIAGNSGYTGRVVRTTGVRVNHVTEHEDTIEAGGTFRSLLSTVLAATAASYRTSSYTPNVFYAWVSPLRELTVHPSDVTFAAAPLQVRQNPTTTAHVAAERISVDRDDRSVESSVWIADSDTSPGDGSTLYGGTVNGYTVAPGRLSENLLPDPAGVVTPPPPWGESWPAYYGGNYLAGKTSGTVSGEAVVVSDATFQPAQLLTVYYPAIDLDGTYAITAVSTRFLGGTGLLRQSTIQFNGERGTVARFNRTRFARAGVTT